MKRGGVYKFGVNDFNGSISEKGVHIREYKLWHLMLMRCYCDKYLKKNPTYQDCEVEPFLLSFTNFYHFIRGLKGFGEFDENGKPFQLDKDLLVKGNKTYGVDTICFIPREVNNFLTARNKSRGCLPKGVCYIKRDNIYQAKITNMQGVSKNLGSFKTPEKAFRAYKKAKEDKAKLLAEKWRDKIDERAYQALIQYQVGLDD